MTDKTTPPKFNEVPFLKVKIPENLYAEIKKVYSTAKFSEKVSEAEYSKEYKTLTCGGISVKNSIKPHYYRNEVSQDLFNLCYDEITPIVEEWSKVKLQRSWGYGIRSYVRNSILHLHRDRIDTHIISCIIYIDQKSNQNWPLDFYDHDNNHHQVYFEDGDMLLYESLCVHGRETPFNGEYYRNMYVHWKPKEWDPTPYKNMKTDFLNGNHLKNYYPVVKS